MNNEKILMCVVALVLGMLLANMLTNVCGCKNIMEGQGQNNIAILPTIHMRRIQFQHLTGAPEESDGAHPEGIPTPSSRSNTVSNRRSPTPGN